MLGILAVIVVINLATFAAFGFDKRQARNKRWRISERSLLFMAALGGWIGAKAGQRHFRHKTYKTPFKTQLNAIPFMYAVVGGALIATFVFDAL